MDPTSCPECGAPAEIVDRDALESTDGPIEHVKIRCVHRHWLLMSAESLAAHHGAAVPASGAARRPVRRQA
jgi:hypothetical protein